MTLQPILFRKNCDYARSSEECTEWSYLEVELLKRSFSIYGGTCNGIQEIAKIHRRSCATVYNKLVSLGLVSETHRACPRLRCAKTQFVKSEDVVPFLPHNGKDSRYLNVNILQPNGILCLDEAF